jgi:hypothetical protein
MSITLLVVAAFLSRQRLVVSRAGALPTVVAGVTDMAANVLFLLATRAGLLSLAVNVASFYPRRRSSSRGCSSRAHPAGPRARVRARGRRHRADRPQVGSSEAPSSRGTEGQATPRRKVVGIKRRVLALDNQGWMRWAVAVSYGGRTSVTT